MDADDDGFADAKTLKGKEDEEEVDDVALAHALTSRPRRSGGIETVLARISDRVGSTGGNHFGYADDGFLDDADQAAPDTMDAYADEQYGGFFITLAGAGADAGADAEGGKPKEARGVASDQRAADHEAVRVAAEKLIEASKIKLPQAQIADYNHSLVEYETALAAWERTDKEASKKPNKPAKLKMDLSPIADELIALDDALRPRIPGTNQRSTRSVRTKAEVRKRIESEMGFTLEQLKKTAADMAAERFVAELRKKSDDAKKAFQGMIVALIPQAEAEQERRRRERKPFAFHLGDVQKQCFFRAMEAHQTLLEAEASSKKKRSESWEAEQRGKFLIELCEVSKLLLIPETLKSMLELSPVAGKLLTVQFPVAAAPAPTTPQKQAAKAKKAASKATDAQDNDLFRKAFNMTGDTPKKDKKTKKATTTKKAAPKKATTTKKATTKKAAPKAKAAPRKTKAAAPAVDVAAPAAPSASAEAAKKKKPKKKRAAPKQRVQAEVIGYGFNM